MTKCQQYFITEPSRSVDFVRRETATPSSSSSQVQTVEPRDNIRKVSFTSAGTEEEGGKDKEVASEQT